MEVKREKEKEYEANKLRVSANHDDHDRDDHDRDDHDESSRLWSLLASKDRDFLLTSDDTQVKIRDVEGKVVGIYFSANWYPPCLKFNQVLANMYGTLKAQGSDFEVVFVSSDEDVAAFDEYRAWMPWVSVPFWDLDTRRSLSRRFDVEDIPCLVVLHPMDNEASGLRDGVEIIYRFGIQAFPFSKERLEEVYKQEKERQEMQTLLNLLTSSDRDYLLAHPSLHKVSVSSLEGKTMGLYFSAQWCLPCLKFTPKLASIYQKMKQKLHDFEIVFISSDNDESSFRSYFRTMPWLALPYGDPAIKALARHFDVRVIPSLVILGPDGKTVTKQGRNLINLYQENAYPFNEARLELLERQVEEEAKNLPTSAFHLGHPHELNLVSQYNGGGPFICCVCDEQGSCWAYQCLECGYEVHPKCVRPMERSNA